MAEELTEQQTEQLQKKLLQLRDELKAVLENTEEGAKPVDLGEPIGRLSRMDALQQQSMAKASRKAHQIRLQQVGAALEAIKKDDFGLCKGCEEPIGMARLSARPETPFCLKCQGRREGKR